VEREERIAAGRTLLARTSWDSTAARMADLLDQVLPRSAPLVGD